MRGHTERTWANGTLSGSCTPKVMLYRMDSANRTGSWLTMDTCNAAAAVSFITLTENFLYSKQSGPDHMQYRAAPLP